MNNMKKCDGCGEFNSVNAKFCHKCGCKFPTTQDNIKEVPEASDIWQTQYAHNDNINATGLISDDEFRAYAGKKADKFLYDFKGYLSGKKSFFSPLVFFMSLLISPIIGALWFLHRKVYKFGALFLAIGVILSAVNIGLSLKYLEDVTEVVVDSKDQIIAYLDDSFLIIKSRIGSDSDTYEELFETEHLSNRDNDEISEVLVEQLPSLFDSMPKREKNKLINIIEKQIILNATMGILSLGYAVLLGFMAKLVYFKDAKTKILRIKQLKTQAQCLDEIRLIGGTKALSWILVLLALFIISITASAVSSIDLINNIVDVI